MSRKTAQWQGYLLRMGPAYLVLVICLAASWVVYHRVSENVEARDEARFDQLTKGASNAVVQRIETYISALRGARGLFEAYHRVGVRQWHDYVRSLRLDSNYRGMMDIGYAERVEGVHRESHVALMRSQGMADYRIHPAGARSEYFPVLCLSTPAAGSKWAPGWDLYSEPRRREAVEAAMRTHAPVATAQLDLFSAQGGETAEPGFIIYLAIGRHGSEPKTEAERREATTGVVFASIRPAEFARQIFGDAEGWPVDIEVYDGETPESGVLMYDRDGRKSVGGGGGEGKVGRKARWVVIEGLGRRWGMHVATLPAFELDSRRHLVGVSVGMSAAASGLLFAIAWGLCRARVRAEQFTASLRKSEESLRLANRELEARMEERRRAEVELAAEKEHLAVTLKSLCEGVISTDAAGRVTLVNAAAEELTGWSQEEGRGRALGEVFKLIDEKTRALGEDPVQRVLNRDTRFRRGTPELLVSRDGREHAVVTGGGRLHDLEGNVAGIVVVFRDVTESRKLEAELNKASKLESLGVLAGGIAHDFNNILTSILGNVSLASMQLPPSDPAQERLEKAEAACQRARDLTAQLLTFARGGAPVKRAKPAAQLLREACDVGMLGSSTRAEFRLPEELWPVDVDPAQIGQVFNNMLINAVQAMPDGGVIRVTGRNVPAGSRRDLPLPASGYVCISIEDEGPGIPPEHLQRIFDPFFTTKNKSRGLGLATAYSIVRKHEGLIEVESQPDRGAVFHVYLPAAASSVPSAPEPRPATRPATGRVLVMDDEPEILSFLQLALKRVGFEAEVARNGEEALRVYREAAEGGRPFGAVIMDLTVPGGMGGKEAIRVFREYDPQVRAIVSSGYSNDPVMADYRRYGFSGVVPKPYQLAELAQVLREVMGGAAEPAVPAAAG